MNYALILAGGNGSRSGLSYPKQFYKVHGKPILVYTLEKFQLASSVDCICVICSDEWKDEVLSYRDRFGITKLTYIFPGGNSGLASAFNGVKGLSEAKEDDIILLHDGVRPFVDVNIIENNIQVAKKKGNAMAAVDCVETIVFSEDGIYSNKVIPRDGMKRIQTPQTFLYGDIYKLLASTDLSSCKEPSAFSLWMARGNTIYCSRGNEKNIKITYPEDIDYFAKLFD